MRLDLMKPIGPLAVAGLVFAAPLGAQEAESVLSSDEVRDLVVERSEELAERRSALTRLLQSADVRRIAASAGIDIHTVESAAATLSDEEVRRLAPRLRDAEHALAGGQAIVISTTAIIIALLILIILLVA